MNLHNEKLKYFDKESTELVELMTVVKLTPEQMSQGQPMGSTAESEPSMKITLSGRITRNYGNEISSIENGTSIGVNEENGKRFHQFVTNIYRDKNINGLISRNFIEVKTWDWLYDTKKNNKANETFSSYIVAAMEQAIATYRFYFPIEYLLIHEPFTIGNIDIAFFTGQYFDERIAKTKEMQPDITDDKNIYVALKKQWKGHVYASCRVQAEKDKAKEIALNYCALSVDALKICSATLNIPDFDLVFDIDSRLRMNPLSDVLVEHEDFLKGLNLNSRSAAKPVALNQAHLKYLKQNKLETFDVFLRKIHEEQSELQRLIIQGIGYLADALTTRDHHKRVAEIFTVLESLLLIDRASPIGQTVQKYASRLIHKGVDERKKINALLSKMYDVRSEWVHHANRIDFTMTELAELQETAHKLLLVLIKKSATHQNKKSILDEIEAAILAAG